MNNDKFSDSLGALLEKGRLNYAINTLKDKCNASLPSHPDLGRVAAALERVSDTYGHMRQYLISGNADPDRERIYEEMKTQVKDLGRQYLFIVNEDRLDPFFGEYRLQKVRHKTVAEIAEELEKTEFRIAMAKETEADTLPFLRKREELTDALFRKVWTLPPWAAVDHLAIENLISKGNFTLTAQLISALLLGLLKFNDPGKMMLLIKAYEGAEDERISARALTAIVIALGRWSDSAICTPALSGAFQNLEDSILTYSRLRDIVMTLIRTRDTDRVSREVNEAFNTTMKEITPEMLDKLQREGLTIDSAETGLNPEWEKLMHNKEIEDRMKAINDMQLEGMDVMMQTFSKLKTFPFFRSVSNWFAPFTTENSHISPLFETFNPKGFEVMADATDMCASDRYSFALGIMQMPEERRNMLAMHFGSQLEALQDIISDKENVRRKSPFATESLIFARDLYRFAKLYPKHNDFYDPFESPIDFLQLPLLRTLLAGDDIILKSADFYFQHGYYELALALYQSAGSDEENMRQLYEKIGFCHQMCGDYASALENYEKADLFSTDAEQSSSWLLKKLAFCNKALGRYGQAAEYYTRLLERHPDDLKLEFHLGSVLLRCGEMERGKELIQKVHYLDPEHKMASRICMRMKGHEAFLEGRYRDALSLYDSARGKQSEAEYHADLISEITSLSSLADLSALRILLDN